MGGQCAAAACCLSYKRIGREAAQHVAWRQPKQRGVFIGQTAFSVSTCGAAAVAACRCKPRRFAVVNDSVPCGATSSIGAHLVTVGLVALLED